MVHVAASFSLSMPFFTSFHYHIIRTSYFHSLSRANLCLFLMLGGCSSQLYLIMISAPLLASFAACSDAFRSEEHTSELQSRFDLVCRLLLEKKKRQGIE